MEAVAGSMPRGRPRNLERRRSIRHAALGAFAVLGYGGSSMRAIADAAAISEPLLYRYYPTKTDLLHAVVASVLEHGAELNKAYVLAAHRPTTLREFLTTIGSLCNERGGEAKAWNIVQLLSLPLDAEQRCAVNEQLERGLQIVSGGIAARGRFEDAYVAARTFVGALVYDHALAVFGSARPTPRLHRVFLEQLIELLVP
jgi:AcrR family transcriptional regulator